MLYLRQDHTPMVGRTLGCTMEWPVWTLAEVRSWKAESLDWRGLHGWECVEYRIGVTDPKCRFALSNCTCTLYCEPRAWR